VEAQTRFEAKTQYENTEQNPSPETFKILSWAVAAHARVSCCQLLASPCLGLWRIIVAMYCSMAPWRRQIAVGTSPGHLGQDQSVQSARKIRLETDATVLKCWVSFSLHFSNSNVWPYHSDTLDRPRLKSRSQRIESHGDWSMVR